MTTESHVIDRDTAAKINPLISDDNINETLNNTSRVIYDLGQLISTAEIPLVRLFHVFEAVSSALDWKSENIHSNHTSKGEKA